MDKKEILEKLSRIEKKEDKIKFLENTIKKLKDKELIKELLEVIEDIKEPDIEQVIREEKFTAPQLKSSEIKKENLEETVKREEPVIKKDIKEKKYVSTLDYGAGKRITYDNRNVESPFFDSLKMRLDRAGLLPNDMIFNERNINDIRLYMEKMDIPRDKIDRYVDRITDLKHTLYDPVKAKKLETFNTEYEAE
ncbi:hypothetical protein J4427_00590 [Candidatus Woesearchaeota archaeon]|nr:hypothetical protein [Candidatus Woesearchaeota archaeon]